MRSLLIKSSFLLAHTFSISMFSLSEKLTLDDVDCVYSDFSLCTSEVPLSGAIRSLDLRYYSGLFQQHKNIKGKHCSFPSVSTWPTRAIWLLHVWYLIDWCRLYWVLVALSKVDLFGWYLPELGGQRWDPSSHSLSWCIDFWLKVVILASFHLPSTMLNQMLHYLKICACSADRI